MMDFADWLSGEIRARGWTEAEFARRGKISPQAVNFAVNRQTKPGRKLCQAIARAFDMPLEEAMRRAGLLDELVGLPDNAKTWGARLMALSPEARDTAVRVMDSVLRTYEHAAR